MADLRATCTAAGATDVATYIQSGNVVLRHLEATGDALAARLEQAIGAATGLEVPVLVRAAAEVAEIVEHNPYPGTPGTQLVVLFHRTAADAARLGTVDLTAYAPESLTVRDREVYLSRPDGQSRSPLLAALDKVRPRVTATARNWNTLEKLLAMSAA